MTFAQLKRRGRALGSRCFLCCEEEGCIEHTLMLCSMARELWTLLLAFSGVSWVLPSSVRDLLLGWQGFVERTNHKKI